MSHKEEPNNERECPLCMEPLERDDYSFYPCACKYQVCRFCWHRICTSENGLCPACRKAYAEKPAGFKPLSKEEIQKMKNEKRQKEKKRKAEDCEKNLADVRVMQKNLVVVSGLPQRLADVEILKKKKLFGSFGHINKIVINSNVGGAGSQVPPKRSAYVTYARPADAMNAIQAVNAITIDGQMLKASLGTTKYCTYFLKNQQCPKVDCVYLHQLGDAEATFTKEEMISGKHYEYERHLMDIYLISSKKKEKDDNSSGANINEMVKSEENGLPKPRFRPLILNFKNNVNSSQQSVQRTEGLPASQNVFQPPLQSTRGRPVSKSAHPSPSQATRGHPVSKSAHPSQSQATTGRPASSNAVSSGKLLLAVSDMNRKNVEKTLLYIRRQSVYNQTVKCTNKSEDNCTSLPSSLSSSSSSFTPLSSSSNNFLSSPSPLLHNGDHISSSDEDSLHLRLGDSSASASPQNCAGIFTDCRDILSDSSQCTVLASPDFHSSPPSEQGSKCAALNCSSSGITLGDQQETLSVSSNSQSSYYAPPSADDSQFVTRNYACCDVNLEDQQEMLSVSTNTCASCDNHGDQVETPVSSNFQLQEDACKNDLDTELDLFKDFDIDLRSVSGMLKRDEELARKNGLDKELDLFKDFNIDLPSVSEILKWDEELDFDPGLESNKGLGELIAEEKEDTVGNSAVSSVSPGFYSTQVPCVPDSCTVQPPPGFIPYARNLEYDCSASERFPPAARGSDHITSELLDTAASASNNFAQVPQISSEPLGTAAACSSNHSSLVSETTSNPLVKIEDFSNSEVRRDNFRAQFPNVNVAFREPDEHRFPEESDCSASERFPPAARGSDQITSKPLDTAASASNNFAQVPQISSEPLGTAAACSSNQSSLVFETTSNPLVKIEDFSNSEVRRDNFRAQFPNVNVAFREPDEHCFREESGFVWRRTLNSSNNSVQFQGSSYSSFPIGEWPSLRWHRPPPPPGFEVPFRLPGHYRNASTQTKAEETEASPTNVQTE